MKILKIILLIGIILLGVSFIQKDKLSFPKNEVVEKLFQEPIQTETDKDEFKVSREGMTYTITPLFNYELYGLVVSHHNSDSWLDYYHDKWQDFINIKDICVIWGDNIESEVYKVMKFKNGSWTCHATFKSGTKKEIQSKFKPNCLSNNHLLSDNEEINKILKKAKTGDQIYLKGYLAEYFNNNKECKYGTRKSSTTRTDYFCETIYLTDFQILKRTNIFWHYAYDFSKYLIIFCLIFGVIIFFFFDDFLRKKRFEKQKEILTIDKKGGFMKKPIIIIVLILLTIIGCVGIIYATGNFDKVVGKVFTQDEHEEKEEKKTLTIEEERDNQRIADLQIISNVLNEYANQNKKTENPYPISNGLEKISEETNSVFKILKENNYLKRLIKDPLSPKYFYGYKSDGKTYELTAVLENKNNTKCIINEGNICIYRVKKAEISIKNPEVDNWKIYQNEEYGFEIKYPKNWIVKEKVKQNIGSIKEKYRLDIFHPENITEADIYGNVAVGFSINEDNDKFFDRQLDLMKRDTTLTIEEITINGIKGFKGVTYQEADKAKSMYISQLFSDKEERGIFTISVWTIDLNKEIYQEQANLILSTFRFLE